MTRKGVVVVQHKVKDYQRWRPFFVEDVKRQKRARFTSWRIGRNIDDPDDVVIIFECEDLDKAKETYADPEVAEIVRKAGVIGTTTFLLAQDEENSLL